MSGDDLGRRDARVCWHPYTQHGLEESPQPVRGARGAHLELADGRVVLDAISSWWACLHGHGHPRLVEAMEAQARRLDHVMFAGFTHDPAVTLAERLLEAAPPGLGRAFFSDNGSTAVEVALKMIVQAFAHADEPRRRVFVALEGAYHGDTFGAMSVSDPDPFFRAFEPMLFRVRRAPRTATGMEDALEELGEEAAGIVLEPLVQGAAGMVMHPPELVRAARRLCDERGLMLVADEVMVGFGRTGTLFACEQAGVTPDALCLAKGLTGGMFPLAVTLATERLFEAFLARDRSRAFFHGHTFTANPVGCAVALASLQVCREEETPRRLDDIGRRIEGGLSPLVDGDCVREVRRTGGIVAVELAPAEGERAGYLAAAAPRLRRAALERGVLLRPLGNVLYALPPSCTTEAECDRIATVIGELVEEVESGRVSGD